MNMICRFRPRMPETGSVLQGADVVATYVPNIVTAVAPDLDSKSIRDDECISSTAE